MQNADRSNRWLVGLFAIGGLFALVLGCTPDNAQSTFDAVGPVARSQLQLFQIVFYVALFVFILVEGGIVYVALKYRQRKNDDSDPHQTHGNTRLEIIWTAIPVVLLLVVAVPTVQTVFANHNSPVPPESGGLYIEAEGHQWWFEFRYPELGVTTANEFYIPVGQPINFQLTSVDVIHSFWVPKLGGKVDMVPSNENSIWLQADEPGFFFGQCAEFCGISHANMRFRVVAVTQPEFDAWVRAQTTPAFEPVDPLAMEGKALFEAPTVGCIQCHTIQGNPRALGQIGPDLTHVASRRNLAAGIMDNTDGQTSDYRHVPSVNNSVLQANLREWITDPESIKPGNVMTRDAPVYNGTLAPLNDEQISKLVAYLMVLK
jgi:cytochrome c oxidase subunit 2